MIELFCAEKELEIAGYIPFSQVVIKSIENAVPLVEFTGDDVSKEVVKIWDKIVQN